MQQIITGWNKYADSGKKELDKYANSGKIEWDRYANSGTKIFIVRSNF